MSKPKTMSSPTESTALPQQPEKGRPPASPNRQYDHVDAQPTKCLKCGSTERTKYLGAPDKLRQVFTDGVQLVIWRKCQCLKCGQWRKDKYQHTEPHLDQ